MNIEQPTNETNGLNGHGNGSSAGKSSKLPEYSQKAARSFLHGRVVTFVMPHRTLWGEVEFRVKQARLGLNSELSDLLREEDLWDAIRGLHTADRWIKRRQRAYQWKAFVAGFF